MNSINELVQRKVVIAIGALVLGLALGVLYAWVLNPVEWVDGVPSQLRDDLQVDYLRMAIDSYAVNADPDLARERFDSLGESKSEVLAQVGKQPGGVSAGDIQKFRALVEIVSGGEEGLQPAEPEEAPPAAGSSLVRLLIPVCGATLLIGVLLAGALVLRRRMESRAEIPEDLAFETAEPYDTHEPPLEAPAPSEHPLATFRTTYTLGDDLYDDSFSIESSVGDFLGECGVGLGDMIGVGEPKKVSAFEIWLFDKNDIQTVTKVLMSRYAYADDETRSRLSAKGDPEEARSGGIVVLETASLRVEARVVDLGYGEGALPGESFFERLTIELQAFAKGGTV
jgi:hypothetical protein